jgi:hypothetical protein
MKYKELFWRLFVRSGDPRFYLQYKQNQESADKTRVKRFMDYLA